MDKLREAINEQLQKLAPSIPPHVAAPILIGLLTAVSAAFIVQKSIEQDIYEPKEKHVIKVEEVKSIQPVSIATNLVDSYGITL